jgi:hypothetical protein
VTVHIIAAARNTVVKLLVDLPCKTIQCDEIWSSR